MDCASCDDFTIHDEAGLGLNCSGCADAVLREDCDGWQALLRSMSPAEDSMVTSTQFNNNWSLPSPPLARLQVDNTSANPWIPGAVALRLYPCESQPFAVCGVGWTGENGYTCNEHGIKGCTDNLRIREINLNRGKHMSKSRAR